MAASILICIYKRMSGQRANIINGTEGIVMLNHFTKHHNITDMVIKPIVIYDSKILRKREQFWITLYFLEVLTAELT